MKKTNVIRLLLLVGVVGVLTLAMSQPSITVSAALPPRPTPSPTPIPTLPPTPTPLAASPKIANGGVIQLQISFDPDWPWDVAHWQTLWTVVQWQDQRGVWHDVEGWQGSLDELVNVQGYKSWWVASENLGRGPFRWAIYKSQGGILLYISEPFDLPATSSERVTVEASLAW